MTAPLGIEDVKRALRKFPSGERVTKEHQFLLTAGVRLVGRVTLPRGRGELAKGTFASICRQAGLEQDQMREAAACRFGRAEFLAAHGASEEN